MAGAFQVGPFQTNFQQEGSAVQLLSSRTRSRYKRQLYEQLEKERIEKEQAEARAVIERVAQDQALKIVAKIKAEAGYEALQTALLVQDLKMQDGYLNELLTRTEHYRKQMMEREEEEIAIALLL